MKFQCDSQSLQKSVSIVEKAVSPRSPMQVMENIFFELKDGRLTLRGNDMEIGIQNSIPVTSSQGDGRVLIKAKTISSIVSKLSSDQVDVTVDEGNKFIIKAEQIDFDILGTPSDEYPVFPAIETGNRLSLSVQDLRTLIRYTIFAVSFDETKQFLNGVLIKNEGSNLVFVSTDGYRLSIRKHALTTPVSDFSVIVPFKALSELNKILGSENPETEVSVNISPNQVAFSMGDFKLVTRVIQGQFPDYNQVIPKESVNRFTISRRAFIEASDRSSIIASNSNNVVRYQFADGQLNIAANAPKMGEFKETVPLDRQAGSGSLKVAFNVRLLLDAIKNMESDDVVFSINNELSPCVIRPVNDEWYTYIIMPIRTSDFSDEGAA